MSIEHKTFEDHYYESERLNIEARKELTQVKVKLSIVMQIIEKLEKSNAFYADKERWVNSDSSYADQIVFRDVEPEYDDENYCGIGGKLARQTIKEVEELKKGLA